eukprot:c7316_g1_i1.p1 GENE.c7316_g1_i1~~c7316_g1_i1.p1  ORF type:complete len:122 (+),score=34.00 c7316_g1_i1:24-368(+)
MRRRIPFDDARPVPKTLKQDTESVYEKTVKTLKTSQKTLQDKTNTQQTQITQKRPCMNCMKSETYGSCWFCSNPVCEKCVGECSQCQNGFCRICSTINYESAEERVMCLDCNRS